MRWFVTLVLLALAAWPAAAQENEAEKLFRAMEKKLLAAKTLQVRFDASAAIPPQTGSLFKSTLILGEGDKFRLEIGGKPFGVEGKTTGICDGTTMSIQCSGEKDKTEKVPKGLGANVRGSLLRVGILGMIDFALGPDGNVSPDIPKVSDFKLTAKEKLGEQNTQVIEFTVTEMKDVISPAKWRMKMWLDTQTNLPVKLTMTMPKNELIDISVFSDTYSEFTIDAKVDAKSFELPKVVLLPGASAGDRELKGQTKPPKNGFTVRCLNKDSVLFPEKRGELNLKVECLVVVEKEIQLKPGDFRLALLDAKLQQLDEIAIAIPDDWKTKTFKKGANKDTLTMNLQGGDVVAGRDYYLAIMISTRGTDNVFPVVVRFVKFKVSDVGPGRTEDDPQRVPPPIKQPMPEAKELPKAEVAMENEAEKLFRALEQKVRTAKTLQIRFDATITGADAKKTDDRKKVDAKKWHYKGSAILGEGDKFRWEYEGERFGHEWKRTFVSDGTNKMGFGEYKQPGEDKANVRSKGTEKTPKAFGAHFRAALPRDGFVLGFATDRNSQMPPDVFIMSDFKLAGEEKIGARNTQMIQYAVKTKARDPSFNPASPNVLSMKLWLDAKTKLPVKLAMTGGESDFSAITESYSEFTVDAKVDASCSSCRNSPALVAELTYPLWRTHRSSILRNPLFS